MAYITGVCRAYTDYIIQLKEESELSKIGLKKGGDNLVDLDMIKHCLNNYDGKYYAGGPTANSISVVAALGGESAFIGKIANDEIGNFFTKSFADIGVKFTTAPYSMGDKGSGICVIFVTSDGQRSMLFNRGCNNDITGRDIVDAQDTLSQSLIVFLGFQIRDDNKNSIYESVKLKSPTSKIATSLQSLNEMKSDEVKMTSTLILDRADYIFGNEDEYNALRLALEINSPESLSKIYSDKIFIETLGANGSRILHGNEIIYIPTYPVEVIDTTGAGDAYAGGFLYGLQSGKALQESGKIGAFCSSVIISQIGARPKEKIILPEELK